METQDLHRGRLIDHLQLVVADLAASKAFYSAVLEALEVPMGGTGYYAAFVLDPDGNNIEAVYHGEARRSAPSVHITF